VTAIFDVVSVSKLIATFAVRKGWEKGAWQQISAVWGRGWSQDGTKVY